MTRRRHDATSTGRKKVSYHDGDLPLADGQVPVIVDEEPLQSEVTLLRDAVFRRLAADEEDDAEAALSDDLFCRDDVPPDSPRPPEGPLRRRR